MAPLRALPPELLTHILLFLVDLPAQQKMSLSHVGRQWRDAALGSSQFWATINVHDFRDLRLLDALLERSGTAALRVHIERAAVDEHAINDGKDDDWEYVYADDLAEEQLGHVMSHAARLQTLELGFQAVAPFEEILRGGLYFPVLETLVVQYDQPEWFDSIHVKPFFVNWLAPALRTLELTYVHPLEGWTDLLQNSPLLENMSVTTCVRTSNEEVDALLASAFGRCHNLRNFALAAPFVSGDDITVPAGGWKPSSNLHAVELRLAGFGEETILGGLSTTFLPSITITTNNGIEFPDDPIVPLLMRGIERVVAIEVEPEQNVTLRDENGNERRLLLDENRYQSAAYFKYIWRYLCEKHGAATASASFTVTSENWYSYSVVFSEMPSPADVELCLSRCLWAEHEGHSPSPLFGPTRADENVGDIRCNARRVCFNTKGANGSDVAPLQVVLRRIKSPSSVELCLGVRPSHVERERWIDEGLSIVADLNTSHDDEWTLCALCATASH